MLNNFKILKMTNITITNKLFKEIFVHLPMKKKEKHVIFLKDKPQNEHKLLGRQSYTTKTMYTTLLQCK